MGKDKTQVRNYVYLTDGKYDPCIIIRSKKLTKRGAQTILRNAGEIAKNQFVERVETLCESNYVDERITRRI